MGLLYSLTIGVYLCSAIILYKLIYRIVRRYGGGCDPIGIFASALMLSWVFKVIAIWCALLSDAVSFNPDRLSKAHLAVFNLVLSSVDLIIPTVVYGAFKLFGLKFDREKAPIVASGVRYKRYGILVWVGIILCWVTLLVLIAVAVISQSSEVFNGVSNLLATLVPMLVLSFPMISLARQYVRYGRIVAESERTLKALETGEPPILFLRSFQLDQQVGDTNLDEELCHAFQQADVPVISLCDPNQTVPSGGSVKLRARNDGWKNMVEKLLPQCRAVVMFEGVTDGLNWEVSALRALIPPERFFIATPSEKYRIFSWFSCPSWLIWLHRLISKKDIAKAYEFVWDRFQKHLSDAEILVPDTPVPSNSIVTFDEKWHYRSVVMVKHDKGLFGEILSLTASQQGHECDYKAIATMIRPHEVVQVVAPDEYEKLRRLIRWLIALFFTFSILLIVSFFIFICISSDTTARDCAEVAETVRRFDDERNDSTLTNEFCGSFFINENIQPAYCIRVRDYDISERLVLPLPDCSSYETIHTLIDRLNSSWMIFDGVISFDADNNFLIYDKAIEAVIYHARNAKKRKDELFFPVLLIRAIASERHKSNDTKDVFLSLEQELEKMIEADGREETDFEKTGWLQHRPVVVRPVNQPPSLKNK